MLTVGGDDDQNNYRFFQYVHQKPKTMTVNDDSKNTYTSCHFINE